MSRARFFYGVAAGLGGGWLLLTLFKDDAVAAAWLLIITAASLAVALVFHQQHVRLSKGRRWRRRSI